MCQAEPFDAGKLFDRIILQHGPMIKMSDTKRTVPVGEPGSTAVSLQVSENVVVLPTAESLKQKCSASEAGRKWTTH
jgi:hypothetical protein